MKTVAGEKRRLLYPELLRVIAILGVIIQHTASRMLRLEPHDTLNYQIAEIFHILVQWCVPLFLSISGIFLLDPKRELPLKKIYGSYIPRILIAIIVMVPVCEAVDLLLKGNSLFEAATLRNIAYALICSHGNRVYWYLYMLLGIYLYLPIFRAIVKGMDQKGLRYLLLVVFIGISVLPYLAMLGKDVIWLKPVVFFTRKLKLTAMFQMAYFLFLGYYLHTYPPVKKTRSIVYAAAILCVAATLAIGLSVAAAKGHYVEKWTMDGTPFSYVITAALFLFFQGLSARLEKSKRLSGWILVLGKNSFGVYLIHIMIMKAVYLFTYEPGVAAVWYLPAVALVTALVTNGIVYLLRKLVFIRYWM